MQQRAKHDRVCDSCEKRKHAVLWPLSFAYTSYALVSKYPELSCFLFEIDSIRLYCWTYLEARLAAHPALPLSQSDMLISKFNWNHATVRQKNIIAACSSNRFHVRTSSSGVPLSFHSLHRGTPNIKCFPDAWLAAVLTTPARVIPRIWQKDISKLVWLTPTLSCQCVLNLMEFTGQVSARQMYLLRYLQWLLNLVSLVMTLRTRNFCVICDT